MALVSFAPRIVTMASPGEAVPTGELPLRECHFDHRTGCYRNAALHGWLKPPLTHGSRNLLIKTKARRVEEGYASNNLPMFVNHDGRSHVAIEIGSPCLFGVFRFDLAQ